MDNRELIEKIFDVLAMHDPEFAELGRKMDYRIVEIIEESLYEASVEDIEAISDFFMDFISDARRDSFMLGLKFAAKIIFAVLCR